MGNCGNCEGKAAEKQTKAEEVPSAETGQLEVVMESPQNEGHMDKVQREGQMDEVQREPKTSHMSRPSRVVRITDHKEVKDYPIFDVATADYKEYAIMSPKWFFHPAHLVINLVTMVLYMGHTALPGAPEDLQPIFSSISNMAFAMIAPGFAIMAGAPKWSIPYGVILCGLVCGPVQSFLLGGVTVGSAISVLIWVVTVLPFVHRRWFLVAFASWTCFFQLGMIFAVIYAVDEIDKLFAFSELAQGLSLPILSVAYATIGFASVRLITRCTDTTGLPQVAMSTFICIMASTTEVFRFCALIRSANVEDTGVGTQQMCVACVANFIGDSWKRWVIGKRLLQKVTLGRVEAIIFPERDVFNRTCFYVQYTVLPFFLVLGLWCLFVTEKQWAKHPLYWVAFPLFILVSIMSDAIAVLYHRLFFPVKNESWWQGFWRLNVPGQSWPDLQNDGGKRYRLLIERGVYVDLAEAYAKSGIISRQDLANYKPRYSSHPFFTDELIMAAGFMITTQATAYYACVSTMGAFY